MKNLEEYERLFAESRNAVNRIDLGALTVYGTADEYLEVFKALECQARKLYVYSAEARVDGYKDRSEDFRHYANLVWKMSDFARLQYSIKLKEETQAD